MLTSHTFRCITFAALLSVSAAAQTHRVDAAERVTRAVAVYEWTGDLAKPTAARLVPVSLFIDGELKDGGTFYARPIPLALLTGNLYSLEKAGLPQGTLTLAFARHLQSATSGSSGDTADLGWFGYGQYAPLPPPPKEKPLQASATLPVIVSSKDADRPSFKRAPSPEPTKPSVSAPPAPGTPGAADDPDRPHISKAPESSPTADDPDRPSLRRRDPKEVENDRKAHEESGVSAMPGSLNDDPDRPNMHRGKPGGADAPTPTQLSGVPPDLHQMVAVSDAVTRGPHPFARPWDSPAERAALLAENAKLARPLVERYAAANQLPLVTAPSSPKIPPPTTRPKGARSTSRVASEPKPVSSAPFQFADEHIEGFTLSYGGLPTFVYTATVPSAGPQLYAIVVTQRLPSGELQTALTAVTDSAHLDRTPWLRLVDAVDPDAGHRASLLFELRGQTSRQFALYRILSAKADQIFITNPVQ
jgi:hypothetical protein